jgi:surface antigen
MRHTSFRSSTASIAFLLTASVGFAPVAMGQTTTPPVAAAAAENTGGLSLFNCSATGNRQEIGGVVGGVVGGVIGNRVGGDERRVLGTVIGAAVGAVAGAWIGCKLQQGDQQRAEAATQEALRTKQNQTWSNAVTGASGTVAIGAPISSGNTAVRGITFPASVTQVSQYSGDAGTYRVRSNANLRSSPSTSGAIVSRVRSGDILNVSAAVQGSPWLLVTRDGTAVGYIRNDLVTRTGGAATTAAVSTECRPLSETITTPGGSETSNSTACRSGTGTWEITKA